jgi:transcriptional regulator with XRE-family HTH domain
MRGEEPTGSPDFGKLLRSYRLAAGLSQEALAERVRMSTHGISALERGYRAQVPCARVRRLARKPH